MRITTALNRTTRTLDTTVIFTDSQDIDDLINDIRKAASKSRRNGGSYGAYRKDGNNRVLFEIQMK